MMALNLSALAGGTTPSGFTFTYNVGTVTNYHAYAVVSQVGSGTQPRGTVVLGNWWVKDLGKAVGSATVTCPPPVTPKGTTSSVLGILLLANASDVGGKPYTHPVVDVQIFTPKWYSGNASIQIIQPGTDTGLQLYFAAPFTPFAWDLRPYVW